MRDARGRWLAGPDPDRHALTRAERRRGYQSARRRLAQTVDVVDGPAWLLYRVRISYCGRVLRPR